MTKGYFGYKYQPHLNNTATSNDIGIKDLTSGCLFKFWGQVAGSGNDSNKTYVTTLSGKLMFKETIDVKWYCIDEKYTYSFKTVKSQYSPTAEDIAKLEVVNDENTKRNTTTDLMQE